MTAEHKPQSRPFHALEIAVAEMRKALQDDNAGLALAYLPVVEWAVEELQTDAFMEALDELDRTRP